MKKIFKIISVLSVMVIILTTSCSEKERTWLADLKIGAYLTFEEYPMAVQGVNTVSEVTFAATLYDPTGNVAEYELSIMATVSGTDTDNFLVGTYTTFPISFDWDINDLAAAVGLTAADINFGDTFSFNGVVTHKNGTVYTGETPSYDEDDGLDLAGMTNDEVVDPNNGYRNGFIFGFTIGCPANTYNPATIPGTWLATSTYTYIGVTDEPVTVTLDPEDDNTIIVTGFIALYETELAPLTLFVDPTDNSVVIDDSPYHAPQFRGYAGHWLSGDGTIFPCAGNTIVLNHSFLVDAGSWGTGTLTLVPAP